MCGIIGYSGYREVVPVLLSGLKRMEYRGYDSAGIATLNGNGTIHIEKASGKIKALEELVSDKHIPGHIGLGHTRWATHGVPNKINAHPHFDMKEKIVLTHNGIIENYRSIKEKLIQKGYTFRTDTDTEVLTNLIADLYEGDIEQAVRQALGKVRGTYGIAVLCADEPDKIIAARLGSPLVIGLGEGDNFIASDLAAIVEYTRNVIFLDDFDMAVVTKDDVSYSSLKPSHISTNKKIQQIDFDIQAIEKNGYPHFMLKEINEQPKSIRDATRGRLMVDDGTAVLGGLRDFEDELANVKRIVILACGTSWHAAMIGEYLLEDLAGIPVEVEYASEFRYRNPVIEPGTIAISISQSGETLDTLEAMREAKRRGATTLGIVNVVGSTIARESQGGIYIHAGPEIGVASTKAFTSQVVVLTLLALKMARQRGKMSLERGREIAKQILGLPEKVQSILDRSDEILELAKQFIHIPNSLYLGRGINFPVALEGALKLKEISYIHAEGYPAAEMKHGPIALIDENMPVIFIAVNSTTYEKVMTNIEEVRARKGIIIVISSEGDERIKQFADHFITVPQIDHMLSPILAVVPLQLLAYHIAVLRGCDVDMPRNLAKSVTVE